MPKIKLPVYHGRVRWKSPAGQHGSFVPNGSLQLPKGARILRPNWRQTDGGVWSARLFVGFNVGETPTYEMTDLIQIVRRVLKEQGEPPDSSYLYQRGIYSHAGPDGPVVEEDGAQVIILSLSGETPKQFEQRMVELANVIVDEMQQESVIVQLQEDGVIKQTIGVSEAETELGEYAETAEVEEMEELTENKRGAQLAYYKDENGWHKARGYRGALDLDELVENKRETFKDAKERLLKEFADLGWKVHRRAQNGPNLLKVPYVVFEPTRENIRIWFKPQAAYLSKGVNSINNARSLTEDYRGETADRLAHLARFGRPLRTTEKNIADEAIEQSARTGETVALTIRDTMRSDSLRGKVIQSLHQQSTDQAPTGVREDRRYWGTKNDKPWSVVLVDAHELSDQDLKKYRRVHG